MGFLVGSGFLEVTRERGGNVMKKLSFCNLWNLCR